MPPTNNPESEMTPEKARDVLLESNSTRLERCEAVFFLQGVSYQEEKARGLVGRLRAQIIYQMSPGHSRACTAAFGAGDCSCGYEQMKTLVSESARVLNDSGGPKGPLEGNP